MSDLRNIHLRHKGLLLGLGTACLSKAGLAEGLNPATIKTAAPNGAGTDFCIDGILYHKADTDNIAMTAAAQQAANTTAFYTVSINSSGTVKVTKGKDGKLSWPAVPADEAPLGGFKVVLSGGATFTSGTTDLSAAGVTATFTDFSVVPSVDPT